MIFVKIKFPPSMIDGKEGIMEGVVDYLKTLDKVRTSETYAATLCSFKRF